MRLKSVHIDNYAPFNKVDLDLDDLSYIVVGHNETDAQVSSNGAGKSCLIQAIIWNLFGEVIRPGLLTDDIVGAHGKHVRVVLSFEKDGKEWVIDRARHFPGRRNNEPIIMIDGENVTQHKGNDDFIQAQLGFNFSVFMFAGYSDAENPPFCRLSPAVMLKSFLDILELEKLDKVETDLKSVSSLVVEEMKSNEREIFRLRESISHQDNTLSSINQRLEVFEENKRKKLVELNRRSSLMEDEIAEADEQLSNLPRYELIDKRISENIAKIASKEARVKELDKSINLLNDKKLKKQKTAEALKKDLNAKKKEYENLAENESCVCGYCGSTFEAKSATEKIKVLYAEMEAIGAKIVDEDVGVHSLELEMDKSRKELSQLKEQLGDFASIHADKQEVSLLLRDMRNLEKRRATLTQVELPRLYREADDLEKSTGDFELEMKAKTLKELDRLNTSLEQETNKGVTLIKRKEFIQSYQTRIKDLKKLVLSDFVMSLESQVNANLDKMQTDIRCSIEFVDKKLKLLFTNASKDGAFFPYSIFSRGERSKIDKACALALNTIFNVGLYIDDEGLSGIDWEAAKGLMEFLTDTEDSTRLLVFHNDRVQSHLESMGVGKIEVIKREGTSHAKKVKS